MPIKIPIFVKNDVKITDFMFFHGGFFMKKHISKCKISVKLTAGVKFFTFENVKKSEKKYNFYHFFTPLRGPAIGK